MRAALILICLVSSAHAAEQTRFFGPDGLSTGTSVQVTPDTRRYFDAHGRAVGTATTRDGATVFYDAAGRIVGKSHGGSR